MDPTQATATSPTDRSNGSPWSPQEAAQLYRIAEWSGGYFDVNDRGHVAADPVQSGTPEIDLYEVITHLREERDVTPPVLLRFQDVLRGRVQELNEAFHQAIEEYAYQNRYTTVYPIKANQLREVVEAILEAGAPYEVGLECGSKAELVAGLSHLESDDRLLICNGFKDPDMLRLILEAQRMGKSVIPVVEKYTEFEALLQFATERGIAPHFGARVRLSTSGAGKWAASSGEGAKFGIQIAELLRLVRRLESDGRTEALNLLHFHLGSQIKDIRTLKKAVREITQVYAQLHKRGLSVKFLDVGGGLGVHYGSGADSDEHSINYTLQEYANSVVATVQDVCAHQEVPVPRLLSESGRALTAHHAVLVVEAVDAHRPNGVGEPVDPHEEEHPLLADLYDTLTWVRGMETVPIVSVSKVMEALHDVQEMHEQVRALFEMGYLSIEQKARAEQISGAIRHRIAERISDLDADEVPDELIQMRDQLVDQYLCSFSVFQSILDHWAIDQPFPAMPLHRLEERPSRRAILVDLTCDSDGKISEYVGAPQNKTYLDVHPLRPDEPYYLGVFLTGAYQDIMGDVHNLLGRLPEAHVSADPDDPGGFRIEKVISGDSVRSMLSSVQYLPDDLQAQMESIVESQVTQGPIEPTEGADFLDQYRHLLDGTTYYNASS